MVASMPESHSVRFVITSLHTQDSNSKPDKEGPIHDVSWSPNSKDFGVVYGYMPAKTTIFNTRAVATHNFPLAPRNTILFSPTGRFVLVAGFGNLAGQMDIYDLSKDFAKVTTIEASNASVCEWAPDGKYILTATTSPRLRVDNSLRLWHVGGGIVYNEDMQELYHVCWRPQSASKFANVDPLNLVPAPHESATQYLGTKKAPTKPAGAYRPPGARSTRTPLHFKREDEGGAAYLNTGISSTNNGPRVNGFGGRPRRQVPVAETVEAPLPPGAAPGGGVSLAGTGEGADDGLSKAALKNRKKREAKKAKETAEQGQGLQADTAPCPARTPARSPERRQRGHERSRSGDMRGPLGQRGPSDRRGASRNRDRGFNGHPPPGLSGPYGQADSIAPPPGLSRSQQPPQQIQIAPPPEPEPVVEAPELTVTSPGGGGPQDKKIRSLLKKIRAIDDLKMRQAVGEKLEDTQVKKIGTEGGVRKELAELGYTEN